jgi:dihydrodipicolinate synthase/N-acetylneuraminate lyase
MKSTPVAPADLRGVFAVPPLARAADRSIDFEQNGKLVAHMREGGLSRFMYGGNAFLYHVTLDDYDRLLGWLASFEGDLWPIPSLGPSYGRSMEQARLLRKHKFPCVMALPSGDPRDAAGLERGLREVAEAAGMPLVLYLKGEDNFGADKEAGLDAVGRLMKSGVGVMIKYAVVRQDPSKDAYLDGLLKRVDRDRVISGMGERPAIVHLRDFKLPGFTTGSGCVAPRCTQALFEACARKDFEAAEKIRAEFMPLEDLRDAWNPAKVLHLAVELAGLARTGPILPHLSPLPADQVAALTPVSRRLAEQNANG